MFTQLLNPNNLKEINADAVINGREMARDAANMLRELADDTAPTSVTHAETLAEAKSLAEELFILAGLFGVVSDTVISRDN
ncbi:hypothetical protein BMS3Abin11_01556 [bacterium BMS3Abin11]|nr:hypothetical protein BMS3Abin11_01556 [bacterium BMS3Abin11]